MSITKIYPFDTPANYTYDTDKIEVTGGVAKLKRQKDSHIFNQPFTSDIGFTYDSDKAEFPGTQIQQKDTRPADATLYAGFPIDEDSSWADGSLNNSLSGGAVWSAGVIDLTGKSGKRLRIPGLTNFSNVGNAGCIRFTIIPSYTGLPSSTEQILEYDAVTGNNNAIFISQNTGGNFVIDVRDSSGSAHQFVTSSVSRVTGVRLVCELDFDFTVITGRTRFFVDGVQRGALNTSSFTRVGENGSFYWGGVGGSGDFFIDDIILFDAVQHTSNHAGEIPYSYNDSIYVESIIELPKFTHSGTGFIETLNDFITTQGLGNVKWNVKSGTNNYQYWNGSAWVDSNGTNSQANTTAEMNTNLPSYTECFGEVDIYIKLFFTNNSNTQDFVDDLDMDHTDQEEFYTDNPTIEPVDALSLEGIEIFSAIFSITGLDTIRFTLKKGSSYYYHNGSIWTISNNTYAETNSVSEIAANITTFTTETIQFNFKAFLHSDDGSTNPELDSVTMVYDFAQIFIPPALTVVYGFSLNVDGSPNTETITVKLNVDANESLGNNQFRKNDIYITPRSDGYFEQELANNEDMETDSYYQFRWHDRIENKVVAKQDIQEYNELEDFE